MSVDRGGLQYVIQVENRNAAAGLTAFRAEVTKTTSEVAALKKELASLASTSVTVKAATQQAAVQSARASAAQRQANKAAAEGVKIASIRTRAERRYAAAVEESALKRETARVAEERDFGVARRQLTTQQSRIAAINRLNSVLNKQKITSQLVAEINQRGLRLDDQQLGKLGLLTAAQTKLIKARQRLADATADLNSKQLQSLRIQERASRIKLRAQETAGVRASLAAQGLGLDGKPLPPPRPVPTVQDKAQDIRLKAAAREQLRTLLAAQGLGLDGKPLPVAPTTGDRASKIVAAAADKEKLRAFLAAQGYDINGKPLPPAPAPTTFRDRIKEMLGLKKSTDEAEVSGNRLLFTFRRLVGIFAVFAVVRLAVREFNNFVINAIRVNRELEVAQNGLAAILSAVGNVTDATGEAVSASRRFALAQQIARKQVQLLRVDSLNTTASFEQLTEAYQVALAPGLSAGLNLDEIRKFAVGISQAATAIGLSQQQLAEETRSILSGTITSRNTRIATALGITNADIKRAKELGTLAQLLQQRFNAFTVAGEELSKTFAGVLTRAGTALNLVSAAASEGLFNELKTVLQDIFSLIVDIDEVTGELAPRPEAIASFRQIFGALQGIVQQAREAIGTLTAADFRVLTQTIGTIITLVGSTLLGAIQGILLAVKTIGAQLQLVRNVIKAISGIDIFDGAKLRDVITSVARILAFWTTMIVVLRRIPGLIKVIVASFRALAVAIGLATAAQNGLTASTRAWNAQLAIAKVALKQLLVGFVLLAAAIAIEEVLKRTKILDSVFGTPGDVDALNASLETTQQIITRLFTGVPGQIATTTEAMKNFTQVVQDLVEEADNLKFRRRFFLEFLGPNGGGRGLGGTVLDEFRTLQAAAIEFHEKTKDIDRERQANLQVINGLKAQQLKLDNDLREYEIRNFQQGESNPSTGDFRAVKDFEQRVETAFNEYTRLSNRVQSLRENADVEGNIELANQLEARAREALESIPKLIDEGTTNPNIKARLLALSEFVIQRIELQGREKVVLEQNNALVQAKLEIEEEINAVAAERLIVVAREAAIELERANTIERAEVAALKLKAASRRSPANLQELAESQGNLLILEAQFDVENSKLEIEHSHLKAMIAEKQSQVDLYNTELARLEATQDRIGLNDEEAARYISVQRQTTSLYEALNALEAQELEFNQAKTLEIEKQNILLQQQRDIVAENAVKANDADPFAQINLAIIELNRNLPTQFETIFQTISTGVEAFSGFVSSSIVDAFDPTAKKVDIKERIGQFLRGLVADTIQAMVRIATTKALLGLTGFFGFSEGGKVPAQGFQHGGSVRKPRSHRRRQRGYADGGAVDGPAFPSLRPPTVAASDTVPAWLTPDEFVFTRNIANAVGHDALDRINKGLVDPMAIRSLAGVKAGARASRRASRGPGFAAGGSVPAAPRISEMTAPSASQSSPAIATVVANDKVMERLVAGGRTALLRFLQEENVQFK